MIIYDTDDVFQTYDSINDKLKTHYIKQINYEEDLKYTEIEFTYKYKDRLMSGYIQKDKLRFNERYIQFIDKCTYDLNNYNELLEWLNRNNFNYLLKFIEHTNIKDINISFIFIPDSYNDINSYKLYKTTILQYNSDPIIILGRLVQMFYTDIPRFEIFYNYAQMLLKLKNNNINFYNIIHENKQTLKLNNTFNYIVDLHNNDGLIPITFIGNIIALFPRLIDCRDQTFRLFELYERLIVS